MIQPGPLTVAKGAPGPGRGKKGIKAGFLKNPALSLAEQGVDKNLADRARKAAAMSEAKFEEVVAKAVKIATAAVQDVTGVVRAARAERHKERRAKRESRERQMGERQIALPEKRYGVILADPEWRFEFWSEKGKTNSSADNHYRTSSLDVIKSRDVLSIAADNCVLFLWVTVPLLPAGIEVMGAWGFTYKSNVSWTKHKAGTGYWFRNRHEHLLIGTRGSVPAPADGDQWDSVIEAPARKHSEKPELTYEMIESYYPTLPKIELNQRKPRAGWDGWGNEVEPAAYGEGWMGRARK